MLDHCDPDLLITDLRTPSMSASISSAVFAAKRSGEPAESSPSPAYSHDQTRPRGPQGATRVLRKLLRANRLLSAVLN